MLRIDNVSIRIQQRLIIDRVSFDVPAGQLTVLIGPNGSGKTTLIRGIAGSLPLESGKILFGDRLISRLKPAERARLIALVPQRSAFPEGFSVLETVALGRTPYLDWTGHLNAADRSLVAAAMKETAIQNISGNDLTQISGGEQQRVKLARALAQDAPILILDEPTSFLDLRYAIELMTIVRLLAKEKGKSLLMVIHDLNLAARFADRVLLMDHGRIRAEGYPAEVLTAETLSAVYRLPMKVITPEPESSLIILPQ